MIEILEKEFLSDEGFVVKITEYYLFKWCYKRKETHNYNLRIINEFKSLNSKPSNKIGFNTDNKSNKKRKKNENKSKTN